MLKVGEASYIYDGVIKFHMAFLLHYVTVHIQGRLAFVWLRSLIFGCSVVYVLDMAWEMYFTGWGFWKSGQNVCEFTIVSGDLIIQVLVQNSLVQLKAPVSILRCVHVVRFAYLLQNYLKTWILTLMGSSKRKNILMKMGSTRSVHLWCN